jgi:glycosyltransferase involved in cell wall biosynthesis
MLTAMSARRHPSVPTAVKGSESQVDLAVVSYFNPADFVGGAERIAWAEADLMSQAKRVVFLSASTPTSGAPFRQLRVGGWTRTLFQPLGARRNPVQLVFFHLLSLFNPFVFFQSLALFRRLRPRVVHTHNLAALSPAIWLSARLAGAQVVHTHQDLWLDCEMATMTDREGRPCNESLLTCYGCRALRPPKKLQIKAVSTEIFASNWLRERLRREGVLVPNFSTRFPDAPPATPTAPSTVAFLGALTAHKVGALLEGFELAVASGGSAMKLEIAGTGPLAAAISAEADSNHRITYLGLVDDDGRDRLLRRASVLVVPSTWPETSPLVFFEALAAGLPVIGSDIGGITELERFGNLVLVPPRDADALAAALVGVLDDPQRHDLLSAAARRSRDAASPERFVADVNRVLVALTAESLAAGQSAGEGCEGASAARDHAGERAPRTRMLGDYEEQERKSP